MHIPDSKADPRLLATVMDLDPGRPAPAAWRPAELGAMLRHQLAAPVRPDLANTAADLARRYDELLSADPSAPQTFGDLFAHPAPPLEMLRLVKDFAKVAMSHADGPLPDEIATVLYYAAIVVTLRAHGRRITGLGDEALRQGLAWALAHEWLGDPLRSQFAAAATGLCGTTPP